MDPAKYPITVEASIALANRYTYHKPHGDQTARYEKLRGECLQLAHHICENVPDSRERATALTKLDEVMFFANAGIARNEPEEKT